MLKKILICISHPSRIGLFLNEKIWKSILGLFLLAFIASIPYTVSLACQNELSGASARNVISFFTNYSEDSDLEIIDGKLSGTKELIITGYDAYIYFNPSSKKFNNGNIAPVLEFGKTKLTLTFNGLIFYEKAYSEIAYQNLSIKKMVRNDYNEIDKLNIILNDCFKEVKPTWALINSISMLFEIFFATIISSLVLGLFSSFINGSIPFKLRFKMALDSQYISIIFVLFAFLFNASWLQYVGVVLGALYLFNALSKIVRITIPKNSEEK